MQDLKVLCLLVVVLWGIILLYALPNSIDKAWGGKHAPAVQHSAKH